MITIGTVILSHQCKKDGTYPVNIRITYNRESSYIRTPYFVTNDMIDNKNNIIDNETAIAVQEDVIKIRKEVGKNFARIARYTAKQLSDHFSQMLYFPASENKGVKYVPFVRKMIEKIQQNGTSTYRNYDLSLNRLISFTGHEEITFDDITVKFLENFDKYLKQSGTGDRGRNLYFSNMRKVFNDAILELNDEERGIEPIKRNPFKKFKIPQFNPAEKRARTIEEIIKIRDAQVTKETLQLARDVYMLSFYLVGMNTIDLFNADKIEDGRLIYCRAKTRTRRKDQAKISIDIVPEAGALIEKYRAKKGNRIFDFSSRYCNSDAFNSYVNKYLKSLGSEIGVSDLDFYSARHTWATLFVNECAGTEAEAAFCLNHVSEHKVTAGYIKKDFSRIDRANRKVIDLLYKEKRGTQLVPLKTINL
jgi:integrase